MSIEAENMENNSNIAALAEKFQTLDAKLTMLAKQLDGEVIDSAEISADENNELPAIKDELQAYKGAMDSLKETRQKIYNFAKNSQQQSNVAALDELRQMLNLLQNMKQNANELQGQCDYLKATKESLAELGNNEQLFKLMDVLKDRMALLGSYDEKIKNAADNAINQVTVMEEALDKRLNKTKQMEDELMASCQNLRQAADNIGTVINEASDNSTQKLQESLIRLNQSLEAKVTNMEMVVQDVIQATEKNTARTDDIIKVRGADTILLDENQYMKQLIDQLELIFNDPDNEKQRKEVKSDEIVDIYSKMNKYDQKIFEKLVVSYNYFLKKFDEISAVVAMRNNIKKGDQL